jgi:hypothetical protein
MTEMSLGNRNSNGRERKRAGLMIKERCFDEGNIKMLLCTIK